MSHPDISSGEKKIARKKKSHDHYWNTVEASVTQPSANALGSVDILTGVNAAAKRMMLIKKIVLSFPMDINAAPTPGAELAVFANLNTQQGESSMPGLQHDGTIYYYAKQHLVGGDGATAAEGVASFPHIAGMPAYVEFDDPIPVADDTLTLYIDSLLLVAAQTVAIKLWYRIDDVSFEEALMILESYR
jgi:hypothetical protein